MKIGNKIVLTIVSLWIIGTSLMVFLSHENSKKSLIENTRNRIRDYAALGVLAISASDHAKLQSREDESKKEYIELVEKLRHIRNNSTDIVYVYTVRKTADGKVIFVVDGEESEANLSHLGEVFADVTPLLAKCINGFDSPAMEDEFYKDKWGSFLSAYAPIKNPDGTMESVLCLDITAANINGILFGNLRLLLIFMLASFIFIIPASMFLARNIVLPILDCLRFTGLLAEGNYATDVSEKFLNRKDEIGDLARKYEILINNTRSLLIAIKNQTGFLSEIGVSLYSNMSETATSVNQISANIQGIKNLANNQSSSVSATSQVTEHIVEGINELSQLIEDQSANVTESSASIEEMIANISSVTQTLFKNGDNIKQLSLSSESGRVDLNLIAQDIKSVAKESEGLLEISKVIQSIASQTNLLAMNAAIEAAHAGDSGRGFVVVADEVRILAESSGEQAKTVATVLKKIKSSIEKITQSTEGVLEKFTIIESEIKTVSQQETNIRSAMEEQTAGSKQVLEAINLLNDITHKVKASSTEMFTGSQQVLKETNNLNDITHIINNGMNEMSIGAQEVLIAVNKVNQLSNDNKSSIEVLIKEVAKFKV